MKLDLYFLFFARPSVLQIQKQNSLLNQYCTQQTLFIYCISSWLSIIMILMIIILSCICSISKATNWFVSVCYWLEIKCILAQSGILIKCGIVSQILFSGNGDLKSGDIQTFSGFWQKCYSLAFENWRSRVQAEILQHISNGRHNPPIEELWMKRHFLSFDFESCLLVYPMHAFTAKGKSFRSCTGAHRSCSKTGQSCKKLRTFPVHWEMGDQCRS